jgi:ABC-2 type transport system permease protein
MDRRCPIVAVEPAPSVAAERRIFRRLQLQVLRAIAREAFVSARLRTSVLLLLTGLFWVGLFLLFAEGFQFLQGTLVQPSMRTQIIHVAFNTFFFTLTLMIAMSSAIVIYGGLFRSVETTTLLTLPVRPGRIVLYKYQQAVIVSCWGFILLGTPLLIAYGIVNEAPWLYYAVLGPYMVAFVMIPTTLGAMACLLVAYAMPLLRKRALYVAGAVVGLLACWFAWELFQAASHNMLTPAWLRDMLSRLRFTEQRLFPSWWLSSGLLAAAHPLPEGSVANWPDSLMFLAVLVSNALLLQTALGSLAQCLFRTTYSRLQGLLPSQRPARPILIDRGLGVLLGPFPPLMRSMMIKDVRLFRRDPVLWAQFLIFFALLGLYVVSLRKLEYASTLTGWITVMSFANVSVIALIYSTFATRFVLPLVSLEGRAFWVLGTAPIKRESVITGKFLLAATGSIPPCVVLIFISDVMLQVAQRMPLLVLVHEVAIVVLCLALSALAVGNGARFPNLRENSPSRIAAGFGGTLNLVESCLLIIFVAFATGIPGYFWAAAHESFGGGAPVGQRGLGSLASLGAGLASVVGVGGVVCWLALRMGWRAFRNLQP